jgi:Tfp pilus assembly protein PilF
MRTLQSTLAVSLAALFLGGCASFGAPGFQLEPQQPVAGSTDSATARHAVGRDLLGQGRLLQALQQFDLALEQDPDHLHALNARAVTLARMGELDAAAETLQQALVRHPDALSLLNNLGYVEIARGRLIGAADRLQRALEIDRSNPVARANWRRLAERAVDDPLMIQSLHARAVVLGLGAEAGDVAAASPPPVPAPAPTQRPASATSVLNLHRSPTPAPASATVAVLNLPRLGAAPLPPLATQPRIGLRQAASADGHARSASASGGNATSLSVASPEPGPTQPARTLPSRPTTPVPGLMPVAATAATRHAARIEVSNGNGVRLMATRVARGLTGHGMQVTRITNASSFDLRQTRLYVREGHLEQAIVLARMLGVQPEVRRGDDLPAHLDLRIVLGRDAGSAGTVARITGDIASAAPPANLAAR